MRLLTIGLLSLSAWILHAPLLSCAGPGAKLCALLVFVVSGGDPSDALTGDLDGVLMLPLPHLVGAGLGAVLAKGD